MLNRLLLAVSIVALTAGGAFAQNSDQSPGSSSAPSSSMPSPGMGGAGKTGNSSSQSGASGEHSPSQARSSSSDQSGSGSMGQGSMGQAGSGMSESHSAMTGQSSGNVKEAQQTLKDQGLYKGKVDGKLGPQTKSALAKFQKQNGLKQTAQLDHPTMKALMQSNNGSSGGSMGGSSGGGMGGPSSDSTSK